MAARNKKERKHGEMLTYEVKRAREFDWGTVFDITINDVTIYSCRIIKGKKGKFIAFPSHEGSDGNYYNHAWFDFSEEDAKEIIEAVEEELR